MLRSQIFRLCLLGILIIGIVSIILNYRSRSDIRRDSNLPENLLSSGISRRSTEFEYSQLKDDRVVFKVFAATSTMTKEGRHLLDEVSLIRLGRDGRPTDAIEGQGAIYHIPDKEIEFQENVVIRLADGTHIYADWAGADLDREVVHIREGFRFTQGELEGSGQILQYEIRNRILRIGRGLKISFPEHMGRVDSAGQQAVYQLADGQVSLTGSAEVSGSRYGLRGNQIKVSLDSDRRIQNLLALGSACLETNGGQQFSGGRIELPLGTGPSIFLKVFGGLSESGETGFQEATYEEVLPVGHHLEGSLIEAQFDPAEGIAGESLQLTSLRASGRVGLRSMLLRIDDGRAEHFRAVVSGSTGLFEDLILSGNVRVIRRLEDSLEEILRCDRLALTFGELGLLQGATATGPVDLEIRRGEGYRHFSAANRLALSYTQGNLERIDASRKCVVTFRQGRDHSSLRAPRVTSRFLDGDITRIQAANGTDLEITDSVGSHHAQSSEIDAEYREGRLVRSIHSGEFRLWRRDLENMLDITGEKAVYEVLSQDLAVTGKDRARMKSLNLAGESNAGIFRTAARELFLNRETESVRGVGDVESVLERDGVPTVVTGEEMNLDSKTGWMVYTGQPRLIQGNNLIRGREVKLNQKDQILRVDGAVESTLEETSGRRYEIFSESLVLYGNGGKATYENDVHLSSEDLRLKAPRLDLFFRSDSEQEVERIEADGGVLIEEHGRKWQAERATYIRATDRVVVGQ